MRRFEYFYKEFDLHNNFENALNHHGSLGWEVVSVMVDYRNNEHLPVIVLFKREIVEEKEKKYLKNGPLATW